jgi:hypothetical protein
MQATDFWNLDHMTERRKLDGSAASGHREMNRTSPGLIENHKDE